MTCHLVRDLAAEYVDGRLAPRRRQEIDLHRRSCPACRTALDETTTVKQWLGAAAPPSAPPQFWSAALAAVRAEAIAPPRPLPALLRWQRASGWATAVAALALAFLAPIRIQHWRDNGPANTRRVIGWHASYAARWPLSDHGQMRVVAMRDRLNDPE